ncbi:MAG: NADH-quinone oxidoreductase subunit M, partial [Bradymonadaceae bacterium]
MLLTAAIFAPLVGTLILAFRPDLATRTARAVGVGFAAIPLVLLVAAWWQFDPAGSQFQLVTAVDWIPAVGAGFRIGIDGISLAVATMSALLFVVAAGYPTDFHEKAPQYLAWLLFLETISVG